MSMVNNIIGALLRPVAEGMVKGKSWGELTDRFNVSEQKVCQKMQSAADLPQDVELARHLIGLERWGSSACVRFWALNW